MAMFFRALLDCDYSEGGYSCSLGISALLSIRTG